MIGIVRKNLACLLLKRIYSVSSAVSPHLFSTQSITCPRVYDLLLHKHQFSPELASLAAPDSGVQKSPENVDPILSFLKDSGCSTTQLQKLVKYKPRILSHSVEDIKFKIRIFQDLGLSPDEIAKMISDNQVHNLEKTLVPNVEFLKSVGVPMDHILSHLKVHPRSLLIKPDVMRKSVEKVKELGFNESERMFVHALRVIASMRTGMWEVKLQSFQEMGFSESDTLIMFKKYPTVVNKSTKKIEKVKQLLLATGKFSMPSIVNYPRVFGCSIELRLEPRLRILQSNNLIKWPTLATMFLLSEDKFFERFVRPYPNEVGEAFATKSCVKDKN